MEWKPIRSEAEYDKALSEVSAYFSDDAEAGTADGDCFAQLVELIQAYEAKH